MIKSVANLGKTLNRDEQKQINGGYQCDWWTCQHWDLLILKPACSCDDYQKISKDEKSIKKITPKPFIIMKKSILNLGKALNKVEQNYIVGGGFVFICTPQTEGCQCLDTPSGNPGICFEGVCYDC